MKKIFTLTFGLFLVGFLIAAGRGPNVTLNTSSDFEVSIDGKNYFSKNSTNTVNIPNMQTGRHTIEVYEIRKKLFGKDRKLVSSSYFDVRDRDISINVNQYGQIDVRETGYSLDPQDNRNLKNSDGNNSDRRSRGRGHKYGHNKDWKNNKIKKDKDLNRSYDTEDDDDDREINDREVQKKGNSGNKGNKMLKGNRNNRKF